MSNDHKEATGEVETALLDAELFIKYGSPDRALRRLRTALDRSPGSIPLRERMREVAAANKHPEEAARHCLALASLYIERDEFDAIQAIENSRLTGALVLGNNAQAGRVLFNDGQIVGAESGKLIAHGAFRQIVEVTGGTFEFQKAAQSFPVTITSASNTNLILDSLRQMDEEKA